MSKTYFNGSYVVPYEKAEMDIFRRYVTLYDKKGKILDILFVKTHDIPLGDSPIGMLKTIPMIDNNILEKTWRRATEKDFGIVSKKLKKY